MRPLATNQHRIEAALRPTVAEAGAKKDLRRVAYFAAPDRIYARCRGERAGAAAHLDKHPGLVVRGDKVDFAQTVAYIARDDAQSLALKVIAGSFLRSRTGQLCGADFARYAAGFHGGIARGGDMGKQAREESVEDAGERSPWADAGLADQDFAPGLYVVATPLGNAADVTLRALWVLRRVDCVAAEDTRSTAPLLARFGLHRPLVALHRHNEHASCVPLLERLARGERVALVSDAGTPAICDPGAVLVRSALDAGVRVMPIPGPSSLTAALSVAGLHAGNIRFIGFPSQRASERKRQWLAIAASADATALFEAPHRIAATAAELAEALAPARRVVVARELTKKFETVAATSAAELPAVIARMPTRGEYVVLIDAAPAPHSDEVESAQIDPVTARWLAALAAQMPAARAAAIAVKACGLPRAVLYRALLEGGARQSPQD